MGFLTPFLEFREMSGMQSPSIQASQVAALQDSQPDPPAASQQSTEPISQPDTLPPPSPHFTATTPSTQQSRPGRTRVDPFKEQLLSVMERYQPPPADEDELYFKILIPSLKRQHITIQTSERLLSLTHLNNVNTVVHKVVTDTIKITVSTTQRGFRPPPPALQQVKDTLCTQALLKTFQRELWKNWSLKWSQRNPMMLPANSQ